MNDRTPDTAGKCDLCGREVRRRYLMLDPETGERLMVCDLCEAWAAVVAAKHPPAPVR